MALEAPLKLSFYNLKFPLHRRIQLLSKKKSQCVNVFKSALTGTDIVDDDVMLSFLKERQTSGDVISKISDMLWKGEALKFLDSENSTMQENLPNIEEVVENENDGGFLKLTKTQEWISGDSIAPVNKKSAAKEWRNDSEKRKKLNLLKYHAIKRELLFLTIGIGAACCVYCLVGLSVEAAVSYAAGVLFSCLYLQLMYYHTDNISRESIPQIFLESKIKKIGIRSEDLKNALEKAFWGSTMALSSPRLMVPAALYGICIASPQVHFFDFQIVPAMFGFFAYKAAALVQVYRDNEDLLLIFPDSDENEDGRY